MRKRLSIISMLIVVLALLAGCSKKVDETVNPDVILGEYKGLEVHVMTSEGITEEDVEAEIQIGLQQNQELTGITGVEVAMGDLVEIAFEGYLDGNPIEDSKIEGYNVMIGSGVFFDGAEEQLIGALTGDTVDVDVEFPESYPDEKLAGLSAVYKVTIHSVQQESIPELTDEYVRSTTDFDSVEEFKNAIYEAMVQNAKESALLQKRNDVWAQVMDNAEINSYPQEKLDKYIAEFKSYDEQAAELNGVDIADYITQYLNLNEESYQEAAETYAKTLVGRQMVAEAIAAREKITADQVSDEEMAEYALRTGCETVEIYKELFTEEEIQEQILYYRVVDFVVESAVEI